MRLKGSKRGKGPAIKEHKRTSYTLEQKLFACDLKKSGKRPKEILKLFKDKYGLAPKPSTLATFYKAENMKRFEEYGHRDTRMASVETTINKTQRPTIMVDMEFALLSMVKKSITIGNAVTKSSLKKMGKNLFNRLRALLIYDDSGERLKSLSDLSEEHMNTLLATANTICPLCKDDILAGHAALLEHLHNYHAEHAAQTGGSTPEKATYEFNASDGWVKNFLRRHNMHNVTTVGEMGSSDHEGAKTFVNELKDELIRRQITPKKIVEILIDIDETGIVYKSVPKRTYKLIGQ